MNSGESQEGGAAAKPDPADGAPNAARHRAAENPASGAAPAPSPRREIPPDDRPTTVMAPVTAGPAPGELQDPLEAVKAAL
ncbi:MAG: hypothetical protein O3A42_05545, partial [Actinobacteria bacterium]|nr:hypothetical protein [Actinomycetota bacterium]